MSSSDEEPPPLRSSSDSDDDEPPAALTSSDSDRPPPMVSSADSDTGLGQQRRQRHRRAWPAAPTATPASVLRHRLLSQPLSSAEIEARVSHTRRNPPQEKRLKDKAETGEKKTIEKAVPQVLEKSQLAKHCKFEAKREELEGMPQGDKLKDKFEASENYTIEKALQQTSDKNHFAENDKFGAKQKELEGMVNPITMKVYSVAGRAGGMPGGEMPGGGGTPSTGSGSHTLGSLEEVDCEPQALETAGQQAAAGQQAGSSGRSVYEIDDRTKVQCTRAVPKIHGDCWTRF